MERPFESWFAKLMADHAGKPLPATVLRESYRATGNPIMSARYLTAKLIEVGCEKRRCPGGKIEFVLPPAHPEPTPRYPNITVIHGPRATGKTLYADRFKSAFGAKRILDGYEFDHHCRQVRDGDLILTNEPEDRILKRLPCATLVHINYARQLIGLAPAPGVWTTMQPAPRRYLTPGQKRAIWIIFAIYALAMCGVAWIAFQ